MKKRNKIILIILVVIILLPFLGWIGIKGYSYYVQQKYVHDLKEPYIKDAENSLGGETPMDAYHKFRQALKNNNQDKALKFLFKGNRKEYDKKLDNSDLKESILDMPKELKEESRSKCTGETIACQERAVYSYKYKIEENKKKEVLGQEVEIKAGEHEGQIVFIKNLLGEWQIEQI